MRIWLRLIIWGMLLAPGMEYTWAETVRDYAVQIKVNIVKEPALKIIIEWDTAGGAGEWTIFRKEKNEPSFLLLTTVPGNTRSFVDTNVISGKGYEYRVRKDTGNVNGYVYAGSEIPLTERRGIILLIIDETIIDSLDFELKRFEYDLTGDGWIVSRFKVPRTEKFNPFSLWKIKNLIFTEFRKAPEEVKAVILFGRIAVPYSGSYPIDGHVPKHQGAFPSDVFYSIINGDWTDVNVRTTAAEREENHNIPLDGKFDQSVIPQDATLQVGRIDFYNLPAFQESEIELYRRYLDKNHGYRLKTIKPEYKALIDDGFGIYNGQPFAANAWMGFSALVGPENIDTTNYRYTLRNKSYLWSYACNAGSYNSIALSAYTDEFATEDYHGIFTVFLGSYNVDWDSQDNLLRAAIASKPSIIECFWAGRPFWFLHHLSMGETIGYATVLTQNNNYTYNGSILEGLRGVHIALMGDPTIRMHVVPPVKNLLFQSVLKIQSNKRLVRLTWDKPDEEILGYNIYRSGSLYEKFIKLNDKLIINTDYMDTNNLGTKYLYQVRAVRLEKSSTGTYYNQSQGIFLELDETTYIAETEVEGFSFNLSPNPVSSDLIFSVKSSETTEIEILNIQGVKIYSVDINAFQSNPVKLKWDLTDYSGNKIPTGVYTCKVKTRGQTKFFKFVKVD